MPWGVAVHPDGSRVYVANYRDNTVSVIDTVTNTLTATVPVAYNRGALGVALNPGGTRLYVTNSLSNTVSVIDTATDTVMATVPVGSGPLFVAVHPAGTRVYVTNYLDNTMSVINPTTNTVMTTVTVGRTPRGVAVHPAGTAAYVLNFDDNTVSVINAATNTVTATIAVGNGPGAFGQFIGPLAPPQFPGLTLGLNQATFHTWQQLTLGGTVYSGATPVTADVYVAVQLPDGGLLFLQGDGNLTWNLQPLVRNWPISPFSGHIFSYDFSGREPIGDYTWLAAFTQPGTLNFIGPIVSAPFSFSP